MTSARSRLRSDLRQSPPPEQPIWRRQPTAEGGVEFDRIARAAGGVDVLPQVLRSTGIENVAGFLERGKSVGVQHLRPHIAVISRGAAAAGEHVLEVGGAVADDNFSRNADARRRVVPE